VGGGNKLFLVKLLFYVILMKIFKQLAFLIYFLTSDRLRYGNQLVYKFGNKLNAKLFKRFFRV